MSSFDTGGELKMRGPPPKPTALKRLQGTFRSDRAVPNEAHPAPALPPCPKGLSPAARKEYQRTGKRLLAASLMTKLDGPLLAGFAAVWARWLDAEAELQRTGPVVRSPNGYPILSPFLVIANSCLKQLRLYANEFGMSPASRTRVAATDQPAVEDEFDAYLSGRTRPPGAEDYDDEDRVN